MRFALLLVAAVLVVGTLCRKHYEGILFYDGPDEKKYSPQYEQMKAASQFKDSKYPVTGQSHLPSVDVPVYSVDGNYIRTKSSFVIPKSRSNGRRTANPFVGN